MRKPGPVSMEVRYRRIWDPRRDGRECVL